MHHAGGPDHQHHLALLGGVHGSVQDIRLQGLPKPDHIRPQQTPALSEFLRASLSSLLAFSIHGKVAGRPVQVKGCRAGSLPKLGQMKTGKKIVLLLCGLLLICVILPAGTEWYLYTHPARIKGLVEESISCGCGRDLSKTGRHAPRRLPGGTEFSGRPLSGGTFAKSVS